MKNRIRNFSIFMFLPFFLVLLMSCGENPAEVSDADLDLKPAKKVCTGIIKEKVVNGKTTSYSRGSCTGDCTIANDKCQWRKSKDHNGTTTEWCGCDKTAPDDYCYTELVTDRNGPQSIICPDKKTDCGKNKWCDCKKDEIGSSGDTKIYNVKCDCTKKTKKKTCE